MAAVYRPIDAIDFCKSMIKNMPIAQIQTRVLDEINKMIWTAAPWRWTVGSMPATTVTAGTQDQLIESPGLPSDFLYLLHAYQSDGKANPRELHVEPALPPNSIIPGQPSKICVLNTEEDPEEPEVNVYRLYPKPVTTTLPQEIIGLYKKTAPTITDRNIYTAGALVMPDEWFWVFTSGVLWLAYMFADDNRGGSAQVSPNGQMQFNGQRGVFEANLQSMKQREKLPLWDTRSATQEPEVKDK